MKNQTIVKYKTNTKAAKKLQAYQYRSEFNKKLDAVANKSVASRKFTNKIIRILLFLKGLFTMDTNLMSNMLDEELSDKEADTLRKQLKRMLGRKPYVRTEDKIGRNDSCPCGSGLKYKKCCGK